MSGCVLLVGAGPGDPDLLTVRAEREIAQAEVLLYDALIDPAILELAPPECERIDVGKRGDGTRGVSQEDISALMVEFARAGRNVVRLKGGDPFLFARGGEEASALKEAGIPFEVVPGVSSALAVPAYAGIPVTDRRFSSSFAVITGHRGKSPEDTRVDWEGLARSAETLVILMGTRWIGNIVERIIASGRSPEVPAVAIASGTTPRQRVVSAPLRELPERIREADLRPPSVIVVGEVARFRETISWFERRPLFARRVLVVRAVAQRGDLVLELRRRGAEPVPVALLDFVEPDDSGPLQRAAAEIGGVDWLVFSSTNAVRFTVPHLAEEPSEQPRVACIGSATARAARDAGLRVDVVPRGERFLPEELVREMRRYGPLEGQAVLFPSAELAREAIPAALEAEGAVVQRVTAYRTIQPPGSEEPLREAFREGLDALVLTSPSSVDHLFSSMGESEMHRQAGKLIIACIGPTTANRLRALGFEPEVVSEGQTAKALVDALAGYFGEREDGVS